MWFMGRYCDWLWYWVGSSAFTFASCTVRFDCGCRVLLSAGNELNFTNSSTTSICVCVCVYVYMYVCTYIYVHTYTYTHTHVYAYVRTYIVCLNMVLPWYSYSQYPSISVNSLTVSDPEIDQIGSVRITLHSGAFAKCLCLIAFSNMIRFHSKTALLWGFDVPGNNKTYLDLI